MAISNGYVTNLKGAEIDAERFLEKGADWASSGSFQLVVDAEFFVQLIGVFTRAGLDEFGMTLIGILLYYVTIVPYMAKMPLTISKPSTIAVFLLVVFSPSMLFRIAALLREPYTIFFLTFGVFFLSTWIVRRRLKNLIFGIVFCVIAALFHKAALALLPLVLLLLVVCSFRFRAGMIIFVILSIPLFSYLLFEALALLQGLRGVQAITVILTGDLSSAEQIVSGKSSREFRTTYDYGADWSSLTGVLATVVKSNIYYYGKPFISDVRSLSDLVAFVENFLRLTVLYAVVAKLHSRGFDDRQHIFLLGCYLAFNLIWALGTANYGTGSRHHMTSFPILGLLYYLVFNEKNKKIVG